ncbi:MAG: hypothetical protein Q9219_005344 [cf. Caloplaca sp. 3 TL-2023]
MPSRNYNEYLDAGHSEDEDAPNPSSDEARVIKGRSNDRKRISKRQKISHESRESGSDEESDTDTKLASPVASNAVKGALEPPSIRERPNTPQSPNPTTTPHPPKPARTRTTRSRPHKPGVIYLSRIPPFMRPSTVRHLLSPFGPITRLFLTPEPPSQHTSRVRAGGNKKRSFIDGWIEFASHKHAKTCVAAINGQTMGGRGWYRDDVWNAKYLRGFGWDDLMASVRAEEREREERVRVGVRKDKKEREEFLRGVERGKVEETRRRKREGKMVEDGNNVDGVGVGGTVGRNKEFERTFRQNEVKKKKREMDEQPEDVKRVLSKIF